MLTQRGLGLPIIVFGITALAAIILFAPIPYQGRVGACGIADSPGQPSHCHVTWLLGPSLWQKLTTKSAQVSTLTATATPSPSQSSLLPLITKSNELTPEDQKKMQPLIDTSNWKTYKDSQQDFEFKYPDSFSITKEQPFIPVSDLTSQSNTTISKTGFSNDTAQFTQKAFFILSQSSDTTNCYKRGDQKIQDTTLLNGITFYIYPIEGGAGGHTIEGNVYRNIKENTCFEIASAITTETGSGEGLDNMQNQIKQNQQDLQSNLDRILSTFKFTK